MVYLEGLIAAVSDIELRESLTERLEIVKHKIKFMDTVPVVCFDGDFHANITLYETFVAAGGALQTDVEGAVYMIFHESGKGLNELMRVVPAGLDSTWAPVQYNRVVLLDEGAYDLNDAESHVGLVEDLAEMIYPGAFIFGHEGDKWVRFSL